MAFITKEASIIKGPGLDAIKLCGDQDFELNSIVDGHQIAIHCVNSVKREITQPNSENRVFLTGTLYVSLADNNAAPSSRNRPKLGENGTFSGVYNATTRTGHIMTQIELEP